MRRHILGVISLICLSIAGFIFAVYGLDATDASRNFAGSVCLRLGITLAALWLGLPDLDRLFEKYPPWVFLLGLVVLLMVVANRNFFPFVITLVGIAIAIQFITRLVQPVKAQSKPGSSTKEKKKS